MGIRIRITLWLTTLLMMALSVQGQTFRNDFENGYTWYPPWTNISLTADTLLVEHADSLIPLDAPTAFDTVIDHRCVCEPGREFGLGFSYALPDSLNGRNLHLAYQADYRFPDTLVEGQLVVAIKEDDHNAFWQSHLLRPYANDSAAWFRMSLELNLPADQLHGNTLNLYLWNDHQQRILIDNASITLTAWTLPNYLPHLGLTKDLPQENDLFLSIPGDTLPLTYPIGWLNEYVLDGDSLMDYQPFTKGNGQQWMEGSSIDTTYLTLTEHDGNRVLRLHTTFHKDCLLLRQALVVPFVDSILTVYRRNLATDTTLFQTEYYLDREGFKVGTGERCVVSYHPTGISSTQLDATNRVAFFNIDYWRDHPLIHYPLNDTLEDHFEDRSGRPVSHGDEWTHALSLSTGNDVQHLPRISPVPYGYASGIVFTEHADWTDLRTHRAILFGSETITRAKDATGGFVYYGIPMTKSVFYNNPDRITNADASHGTFPGLQATIKTDKGFEKLLKQLYRLGFDLCLHTPEQYTTTPGNLKEALDYMQRHFKSTTWIDHGYNNGSKHNREDLVCDGLNPASAAFAADPWLRHGVRYLWNAYYEENRMESWCFDNHLVQPYPGFGDALPNRQITPIAGHEGFLTWSTPSTLDANSDLDWNFYYSEERLQKLVDQHSVHITHVYPAWVDPARGFWTYDTDSTCIALPGMNQALARIAALREQNQLLPMTVKTYLDHYAGLLEVEYQVLDDEHIQVSNTGRRTIKGFTLICPTPIRFEDLRPYEYRKSGGQYYIWFDLKANDSVVIQIVN